MSYLAIFHWGWLAGALLLGFCMGWIAVVHRGPGVSKTTAHWLAGLAVILVTLALGRLVPGRPGYWLDLGLVLLAVYMVGCTIGSWLRDRVVSRHALRSMAG